MFLLLRFIAKVISSVSHYIMIQPKSQVNSFEQFIFTTKILRYYMTMNYHLNHTLLFDIFLRLNVHYSHTKSLKMMIISMICFQPSSYKKRSHCELREEVNTGMSMCRAVLVERESLNRATE